MSALNALVSESVDVVVHCTRTSDVVRVSEIAVVEDLTGGAESLQFTVTELFDRPRVDGVLQWTGNLPIRAGRALREAGFEVRELLEGRS